MDLPGWYGPDCKNWLGPNTAGSGVPNYLIGEYPGDYGWDSAGPAADPNAIERLRKAEVLHDRWAMLGTLWCLTCELLQKYTFVFHTTHCIGIYISKRKALDSLRIITGTASRTSGRSRNCFLKRSKLQGRIGSFWCRKRRALEKAFLKAK